MDWGLPPHAEAFRIEVRDFIADHLTQDVIDATAEGTIHHWGFHRELAARGWLNGAVPEELGGGGRDALEMAVLIEELQLAGAPVDGMGVAIVVASVILDYRAFDTLGEATVLFTAVIGVLAVMRKVGRKKQGQSVEEIDE